jgi:hypothetical protein
VLHEWPKPTAHYLGHNKTIVMRTFYISVITFGMSLSLISCDPVRRNHSPSNLGASLRHRLTRQAYALSSVSDTLGSSTAR